MNTLIPFFLYLIKVFVLFAVVYILYITLLSRLTFYRLNRFFLLAGMLCSFLLPLIDITQLLSAPAQHRLPAAYTLYSWQYLVADNLAVQHQPQLTGKAVFNWQSAVMATILAGMAIGLLFFLMQCYSLYRLTRRAVLLEAGRGFRLYRLSRDIAPFSFGNRIFIGSAHLAEAALNEIVQHELAHVRQRHTVDICLARLVVIAQWYNPFAWLLQAAVRQNLEFLADQAVLQQGANRRLYQYHLLHTATGTNPGLANQFVFSSLKKRIYMMNTHPSSGKKRLRLLWLVPVTVLALLAFRQPFSPATPAAASENAVLAGLVLDAQTLLPLPHAQITIGAVAVTTDEKGYYLAELPADSLSLFYTVQKEGYPKREGAIHFGQHTTDGNKTVLFIGLDRSTNGRYAFSNMYVPHDNTALTYTEIKKLYQKLVQDQQEQARLTEAMKGNEKIYFSIGNYAYLVTEKSGFARLDEPTDIVIVNGRRLTGEEANALYKRKQVYTIAANGTDSVVRLYGKGILSCTTLDYAKAK